MIKTYKKGIPVKLSKNFKSTEFDCHCHRTSCTHTKVDEKLVEYLQAIRDHFDKPVILTEPHSGYRCISHNREVGGSPRSKHMQGMAADIEVKDVPIQEVAAYAETLGIKGIGLYEDVKHPFVHIDTRTEKHFWYGRSQIPRETFGGNPPDSSLKTLVIGPVSKGDMKQFKDLAEKLGVDCFEK